MSVRAKFRLDVMGDVPNGENEKGERKTLIFHAVVSSDPESENSKFWNATPSGEFSMHVVNKAAWSQFELGKSYFFDITPAE